jgi:dihydrofolate reductase
MGIVRLGMSVSLDGYAAGLATSGEHPLGIGGEALHTWLFTEPMDPVDAERTAWLRESTGATVIGRRMYDVGAPLWGDVPFPVPSVVLTHERLPDRPAKSATFTFVPSPAAAVAKALDLAGDKDVLVMGGPAAAQACLRAGLIGEIALQLVPVLLGQGVRLIDGLGTREWKQISVHPSATVTHLRYRPGDKTDDQ